MATTIHVVAGKTKEAFEASGCPACGEQLKEHAPADEEDYGYLRFGCGCELLFTDEGGLDIETDCGNATRIAIEERCVFHDIAPTQPL